MNLKKLFAVLAKQERNLKSLLEAATEKKNVLVTSDHDKLFDASTKEEQLLLKIQLTEEDRLIIIRDLFKEYKINNERYKLSILIEGLRGKVQPQILKVISDYEVKIKSIIEKVTNINQLNQLLIQQSSSLINETVRAVISASRKSLILDRKG